jgi:hypothetical protein
VRKTHREETGLGDVLELRVELEEEAEEDAKPRG